MQTEEMIQFLRRERDIALKKFMIFATSTL